MSANPDPGATAMQADDAASLCALAVAEQLAGRADEAERLLADALQIWIADHVPSRCTVGDAAALRSGRPDSALDYGAARDRRRIRSARDAHHLSRAWRCSRRGAAPTL